MKKYIWIMAIAIVFMSGCTHKIPQSKYQYYDSKIQGVNSGKYNN